MRPVSAARHLRDVNALTDVKTTVTHLKALDELNRRRDIHDLIARLAREKISVRSEYRDAICGEGWFGRQDWISAMSEARKEQTAKTRPAGIGAEGRYTVTDGCLYVNADDGPTLLATFTAEIIAYVTLDDGVEQASVARIRVTHTSGRVGDVEIPPNQMKHSRDWSIQAIGPDATILSMSRAEEHVLTAVQLLSEKWERVTKYTFTGWTTLDGKPRFLTASGALGVDGLDAACLVDLGSDRLNHYRLPDPTVADPAKVTAAVRASLSLLEVAPFDVMVPQLAAAYRAPLPVPTETSIFSVGRSGSLKTALAALICQHFGAGLDHRNLAASWNSTANAIEAITFSLANVVAVIDDYAPQAVEDPRRLASTADRVMRGVANSSGRDRLRADSTLRPAKPPRAQVFATGEDVPDIHSLRARLTAVEVDRKHVNLERLTAAQQQGRDGVFALAAAGYIRWIAAQIEADDGYADMVRAEMAKHRAAFQSDGHLREPEATAGLFVAWREWLRYAVSVNAVTRVQAERLLEKVKRALLSAVEAQSKQNAGYSPAQLYISGIRSALASGAAHLIDITDGGTPGAGHPTQWGWRKPSGLTEGWQPKGACIGWVGVDGEVLLDPEPAHAVAREVSSRVGSQLGTTRSTLHKRLDEDGCLASRMKDRIEIQRRVPGGKQRRMLHVRAELLIGEDFDGGESP